MSVFPPTKQSVLPMVLVLSGAPVGKGRARAGQRRKRDGSIKIGHYTPDKTRSYESRLQAAALDMIGSAPPVDGPIEVTVLARMPIPASWPGSKRADAREGKLRPVSKPDADNVLKTLDALNGVVWNDDAQIVKATITKVYAEEPCLIVTIRRAWTGALAA